MPNVDPHNKVDTRNEVEVAINRLLKHQKEHGYDPFGFRPSTLRRALPPVHALYRHYFRVQVEGIENVPAGRALLIANHSGQIPLDAMMIATAMLIENEPPRVTRAMIERWIATLPFVSMFFSRVGQVIGTRANAQALLERDELLMVFPEGSRGISKPYSQAYQLEEFGLGFMRLALQTNTPIVPIGVVGAEEQIPALWNAKWLARMLKMPAFPISPTLLVPLPVKYRIYFGEPLVFEGDSDDEDRVIRARVDVVTDAIRGLLKRGLDERTNPFF